jgi:hypothetical protein
VIATAAGIRHGVRYAGFVAMAVVISSASLLDGCDASFRFDDHDATAPDSSLTTDSASTIWTGSEACTANCSLSCPGPRTCIGTCVGACTAICPRDSNCTLTSGERTTVTCENSRCNLALQHHGVAYCEGTAACDVVCADECTLECGADARCTLQCRGDATPRAVTGLVRCSDT